MEIKIKRYVRVSVKEPDNQAETPAVDLDELSEEELWEGIYIPTHERFFRNPPEGDTLKEQFVLEDWLRQKERNSRS